MGFRLFLYSYERRNVRRNGIDEFVEFDRSNATFDALMPEHQSVILAALTSERLLENAYIERQSEKRKVKEQVEKTTSVQSSLSPVTHKTNFVSVPKNLLRHWMRLV